ncbi:MAG: hypothetical protein JO273_17085 [Methylobacteriaceae bacterium]|nr:hypothetical protein [Methylobacteriaceae bacterium]
MTARSVTVVDDPAHPEGGHGLIVWGGLDTLPSEATLAIEAIDESLGLSLTAARPLATKPGPDGLEIAVGPEIVENVPAGTQVTVTIPQIRAEADVLWPALTPLMRPRPRAGPVMRKPRRVVEPGSGGGKLRTPPPALGGVGVREVEEAPPPERAPPERVSPERALPGEVSAEETAFAVPGKEEYLWEKVADADAAPVAPTEPDRKEAAVEVVPKPASDVVAEPKDEAQTEVIEKIEEAPPTALETIQEPLPRELPREQKPVEPAPRGPRRTAAILGVIIALGVGGAGGWLARPMLGDRPIPATSSPEVAMASPYEMLMGLGNVSPRGVPVKEQKYEGQYWADGISMGKKDAEEGDFWKKWAARSELTHVPLRLEKTLISFANAIGRSRADAPGIAAARFLWEIAAMAGDCTAMRNLASTHHTLAAGSNTAPAVDTVEAARWQRIVSSKPCPTGP